MTLTSLVDETAFLSVENIIVYYWVLFDRWLPLFAGNMLPSYFCECKAICSFETL